VSTRRRSHGKLALAVSVVAIGGAGQFFIVPGTSQPVSAQVPGARPITEAKVYKPGQYVGPRTCSSSNCHGKAEPDTRYAVTQDEFTVWDNRDANGKYTDAHRRAQIILATQASAKIASNLKLKKPAYEAEECLTCHALTVPGTEQPAELQPVEGVTCEACHGPAGGWLEQHATQGWTHEKSVQNGMYDQRNLATRVRNCLGCHLGDAHHEVDHALIAAGHPELLFELDNFSERPEMAHWEPAKVLGELDGRPVTHGVRAWAVAQVEALRYALEQLKRRVGSGGWIEFAELTCEGCHHPLQEKQWSADAYAYQEGFPAWNPARWVVLRILVKNVAPEALTNLERAVDDVRRAVSTARPAAEIGAAADRVISTLKELAPRIAAFEPKPERMRSLLLEILGEPRVVEDRQSAFQATLAVQSLATQLHYDNDSIPEEVLVTVEALAEEIFDSARSRPYDRVKVGGAFRKLSGQLRAAK